MIYLNELISYIDPLLSVEQFKDYVPNGLQVEGQSEVKRIVSGVTACQQLLEAAIAQNADAVLVHHGYFWKGENPCLTGIKRQRVKMLMDHEISLLAYHLPLDAHPTLGNNVELANQLGLDIHGNFDLEPGLPIGFYGAVEQRCTPDQFASHIRQQLNRAPLHIEGVSREIQRVAWCTGGAQKYLEKAVALGVDAYVTGEVSEQTVHEAREYGIHFYSAGHHATERYGVQALGQHLAEKFSISHQFIDIDNPV